MAEGDETPRSPTIDEADDYAVRRHEERHHDHADPGCMFCRDEARFSEYVAAKMNGELDV